jgi:hypothetical protein
MNNNSSSDSRIHIVWDNLAVQEDLRLSSLLLFFYLFEFSIPAKCAENSLCLNAAADLNWVIYCNAGLSCGVRDCGTFVGCVVNVV